MNREGVLVSSLWNTYLVNKKLNQFMVLKVAHPVTRVQCCIQFHLQPVTKVETRNIVSAISNVVCTCITWLLILFSIAMISVCYQTSCLFLTVIFLHDLDLPIHVSLTYMVSCDRHAMGCVYRLLHNRLLLSGSHIPLL